VDKAVGCIVGGLGLLVALVLIMAVLGFAFGLPVVYLWNYIVPGSISYMQAVSMVWLVWLGLGPVVVVSTAGVLIVAGSIE